MIAFHRSYTNVFKNESFFEKVFFKFSLLEESIVLQDHLPYFLVFLNLLYVVHMSYFHLVVVVLIDQHTEMPEEKKSSIHTQIN